MYREALRDDAGKSMKEVNLCSWQGGNTSAERASRDSYCFASAAAICGNHDGKIPSNWQARLRFLCQCVILFADLPDGLNSHYHDENGVADQCIGYHLRLSTKVEDSINVILTSYLLATKTGKESDRVKGLEHKSSHLVNYR